MTIPMITYMMWLGSLCYSCNVRQYPMIYIVVICLILHNTCKYPFSRQLLLPNIISSVYVCGHWAGYLILIWARRRMPARTHRPRQTTAGLLLPILEWQDVSTMRLWTMLCPAATTNCRPSSAMNSICDLSDVVVFAHNELMAPKDHK